MMQSEMDLMNSIRIYLSKLGYVVFRANVGKVKMQNGRWFDTGLPKGHSDLHAVKDGKIYFIEVKIGNNKPSSEQLNFIEQMQKQGCIAGVVWSIDDVNKLLNIK